MTPSEGNVIVWALARVSRAAALVLAAAVPAAVNGQESASVATSLVFDRVTVVDVEHGRLLPAQRVVITGTRIQAVGDTRAVKIPKGAQVVEAEGKYLIPGLWDMHAHVDASGTPTLKGVAVNDSSYRANYPRFVAHGITGVREMAQRFENGADSFRVWQRAVMAGVRVGPRAVGPSAEVVGAPNMFFPGGAGPGTIEIDTPEDASRVVDSLKAAGMAFIKFHDDGMSADLYFALMRAARHAGIPVVGHTPIFAVPYQSRMSDADIADSGQRSIEHTLELRCWFPRRDENLLRDSVADMKKKCSTAAAAAFMRNGTWVVPTLVSLLAVGAAAGDSTYAALLYQEGQLAVRTLRQLGVTRFLAGTDFGFGLQPGVSLLKELKLLVDAGLTPLEALQAATLNPATFLDATDSLGTVAPGKLADLVLLDADPLTDITNTTTTRAVVANGRYFDRAAIDGLLAGIQAKAKQEP